MNYEALQDEIVAKLQPFSDVGITVERLPEVESEKTKVLPTKARFTVIYAGSEYDVTNSTGNIAQNEKIFVQILVESTFLYGEIGIYNLISLLKKALVGFKPQNTNGLQLSKHHTIGSPGAEKINNMWQYQVIFQCNGFNIEDFTEEYIGILKKITYYQGSDVSEVPNPINP